MVIGFRRDPDSYRGESVYAAHSWDPGETFTWGDPISEPMLVVGDMPKDSSGAHLDTVLLWSEGRGFRVTPRMWLVVLA